MIILSLQQAGRHTDRPTARIHDMALLDKSFCWSGTPLMSVEAASMLMDLCRAHMYIPFLEIGDRSLHAHEYISVVDWRGYFEFTRGNYPTFEIRDPFLLKIHAPSCLVRIA
jgi:hypothetical protein